MFSKKRGILLVVVYPTVNIFVLQFDFLWAHSVGQL